MTVLSLFDPTTEAWPFYAGTLLVISVNRFLLAAAQAVVPRLVPREDLLMANSVATVGGTVALLVVGAAGYRSGDASEKIPKVIFCPVGYCRPCTGSRSGSKIKALRCPLSHSFSNSNE